MPRSVTSLVPFALLCVTCWPQTSGSQVRIPSSFWFLSDLLCPGRGCTPEKFKDLASEGDILVPLFIRLMTPNDP